MFELALVAMWLKEKLESDPVIRDQVPGGVHNGKVPPKTPYPCIVFAYQNGTDTNSVKDRVMSDPVYQVVLVTKGEEFDAHLDVLKAIDRINNLNERYEHGSDYIRVTPKGEGLIQTMGYENKVRYEYQGRNYRILVRAGSN